jgi:hypothetical protein
MRRLLLENLAARMIAPTQARRKCRDALMTKPAKMRSPATIFPKPARSLTVSLGNFTIAPNFGPRRAAES